MIAQDDMFLMNWDEPVAFDGRYTAQPHYRSSRAFVDIRQALIMLFPKFPLIKRPPEHRPFPGQLLRRLYTGAVWTLLSERDPNGAAGLASCTCDPRLSRGPAFRAARIGSRIVGVDVVDLVTLLTACTLIVEPKLIHPQI